MYNPQYKKYQAKQTSWGQRVSDRILGTNYVGRADLENRQRAMEAAQNNAYEFQKAVNINKYSWNQQGMLDAGINPLMAAPGGALGSVSQPAQGQSAGGMDQGGTGAITAEIGDMLKEISPSQIIHDLKDVFMSFFGAKSSGVKSVSNPNNKTKLSVHKTRDMLSYNG